MCVRKYRDACGRRSEKIGLFPLSKLKSVSFSIFGRDLTCNTQNYYETYCSTLENYGIVTEGDSKLFSRNAANAASKREQKIQQYRHEKDLRTRIEVRYFCNAYIDAYILLGHSQTQKATAY